MAYTSRSTPMLQQQSSSSSTIRQPNSYSTVSSQQSSALASRIATKRAELDSLKQLRDMSAALSMQMQALESKIGTLKDGTEAIACVLANWDNVLRAISMASAKATVIQEPACRDPEQPDHPMPATLVRIPAEEHKPLNES